jgi:ATP-binding cassette subfamily B protein
VASVLYGGGHAVQNNAITFGTLSVFIAYTTRMFEPIAQLARVLSEFQSAGAAAERTLDLLEEPLDQADPQAPALDTPAPDMPVQFSPIEGHITFENVTFMYQDGTMVLNNFNLFVKAGEKIALVGATGAGKSTIINLLTRFYEPSAGVIKIDGTNYLERPKAWFGQNIGYVLQTPHLFSTTIMENIRYAKPNATDEEVARAAALVHASDFINKKPDGLHTFVGEGGNLLSAGERQLVSFARAMLNNPSIFIFDEATAAIDTETEIMLQKSIEIMLHGRTCFIVAHRLSTIRHCNRILVIDAGKIIELGSHNTLMAQRGQYYKLYTNQFTYT